MIVQFSFTTFSVLLSEEITLTKTILCMMQVVSSLLRRDSTLMSWVVFLRQVMREEEVKLAFFTFQ